MRVLITSSGVVTAAAKLPAMLPAPAACHQLGSFLGPAMDCLINSYNGNWMHVNGISRRIVPPKPRYRPATPSPPTTWRKAAKDEVRPYAAVCCRDLTTSVGTRTRHAATSATDAEAMCTNGELAFASCAWPG